MKIPILPKLIALLVVVPLLDLGAILVMSRYVGGWITFATVVACGVLGAVLVRREGTRAWNAFRQELAVGQMPTQSLLDGVLVLVSGVLLMTPGPLTDALGLILLVPPVRSALQAIVRRKVEKMLLENTVRVVQQATVIR